MDSLILLGVNTVFMIAILMAVIVALLLYKARIVHKELEKNLETIRSYNEVHNGLVKSMKKMENDMETLRMKVSIGRK